MTRILNTSILGDGLSYVNESLDELGDDKVLNGENPDSMNLNVSKLAFDYWNGSASKLVTSDDRLTYTINIVILCVSTVPMMCNIFALWMLCLCKRLPPHLKYPSVSLLLSNLLGFLTVVLYRLLTFGFKLKHPIAESLLYMSAGTLFTVASASVAHMSVDRLIAFRKPFVHKCIVNRRTVRLSLLLGWVTIISVMLTPWLVTVTWRGTENRNQAATKRFTLLKHVRIHLVPMLLFPVLTSLACISLMYQLKANKNRKIQRKLYRVTRILVTIIVVHTLMGIPHVVHFTVVEIRPDLTEQSWRKLLHLLVYVCLTVSSIFDAFFFTLNIKECRQKVAFVFCRSSNVTDSTSKSRSK